jgi:hypothetical protein
MPKALEVIADARGTIVTGFIAPGVYYVRVIGEISSDLGIRCGVQLRRHLGGAQGVTGFFDFASALGSDFAARSAITRALLANRTSLTAIKALVTRGAMVARARAMIAILGKVAQIVEDASEFHSALLLAAPFAQAKLPPSRWIPAARVEPAASDAPRPRSLRPRARSYSYA